MGRKFLNEYLLEKIEDINRSEFHPDNFKELRDLKTAIIADAILNRKENTEHYLKFAERVKDEPYFRLHHIEELGLPYDILIFTSEKNIGKSRQMLTQMNETNKRGKKFVIMRSLEEHIKTGLKMQLMETHSNFTIESNGVIYLKGEEDNKPKGRYVKRAKGKEAGMAMSLTTCTKWKGGSFDDYEWIWFDEATDEHDIIGVTEFNKLFISVVNSIERRKEDFKVIITGNTDFNVTHPLFEFFEIDPSQNLVYTTRKARGADNSTRILYINSRGLYGKGAKSSKFIGSGGDPKAALDAFMNSVKGNTDRLVAMDLTYLAKPFLCMIFKDNNGDEWQLLIAKHNYKTQIDGISSITEVENTWYYIKIEPFQPAYLCGYKILTDDLTMHTLYRSFSHYKKTLINEWLMVRRIIRSGKVIFIKTETKLMLYKLLEKKTENAKIILG